MRRSVATGETVKGKANTHARHGVAELSKRLFDVMTGQPERRVRTPRSAADRGAKSEQSRTAQPSSLGMVGLKAR